MAPISSYETKTEPKNSNATCNQLRNHAENQNDSIRCDSTAQCQSQKPTI